MKRIVLLTIAGLLVYFLGYTQEDIYSKPFIKGIISKTMKSDEDFIFINNNSLPLLKNYFKVYA